MAKPNPEALLLPDALLVRYFRDGEIDYITRVVCESAQRVQVHLELLTGALRIDAWRDLGGGLGYVPDAKPD